VSFSDIPILFVLQIYYSFLLEEVGTGLYRELCAFGRRECPEVHKPGCTGNTLPVNPGDISFAGFPTNAQGLPYVLIMRRRPAFLTIRG